MRASPNMPGMTQTNPWRLAIGILAMTAFIFSFSLLGNDGSYTVVTPLLVVGAGLSLVWLIVSAVCWEIRRAARTDRVPSPMLRPGSPGGAE
jgi:amino acid permease